MSSEKQKLVSETKMMIRETHLDTFGHVNNATYLTLFEEARWDVITARGYGLKEVMERKIGPVILEVRLQYRRELKNRETITIRTWVESQSGKITQLHQVMINEKGEEACLAQFAVGVFDLKARKLIEPTPEWKTALGME